MGRSRGRTTADGRGGGTMTFRTTLGLLLVVLVTAVGWPPAGAQDSDERRIHERYVTVEGPTGEQERAYVVFPFRNDRMHHAEGERYPLVVALHGRGESAKGPVAGPRGWIIDYHLPKAYGAFQRGRVTASDYQGFVTPDHLARVNAELGRRGFGGAMVVTPFVRDPSDPESELTVEQYSAWLAGPLLDQIREEYPQAARGRDSVGVDGVSLGGWLALEAGFRHPEVFGSVGGIQPAVEGEQEGLAERAARARRDGHAQDVRLLTSEEDPYLQATRKLSKELRRRYVPHDLVVLPGPHGYEFNRGPGIHELLRFHVGVLEREPMPDSASR